MKEEERSRSFVLSRSEMVVLFDLVEKEIVVVAQVFSSSHYLFKLICISCLSLLWLFTYFSLLFIFLSPVKSNFLPFFSNCVTIFFPFFTMESFYEEFFLKRKSTLCI